MVIHQGDVFWLDAQEPRGSEPGYRRPFVVVQSNVFNRSSLSTVVACALTTNVRLAKMPGNVLLNKGEGGVPKPSVVNITQVWTVNKWECVEKLGTLSHGRMREILDGLNLHILYHCCPRYSGFCLMVNTVVISLMCLSNCLLSSLRDLLYSYEVIPTANAVGYDLSSLRD